jgi:HAD superfamily hydrolase (TIGR01549 family)
VLDTAVLMRLSAILGVFAELQQIFASADRERHWLTIEQNGAPFDRRAPLDLMRGTFDDQIAVRRHVEGFRLGVAKPNEIDQDFTPYSIIWEDARPQIRAVCFDGFGTLVNIRDQRRPFKALLAEAPLSAASRTLTTSTSLRDLACELANFPDETRLSELEADLAAECASTQPRAGMDDAWEALRRLGLKIGVCSNLAAPYMHALLGCLPGSPDVLVQSFEVGVMKPQPEIYQLVCTRLDLKPEQVLFVGDRFEEDVLGPQRVGLFAMHISEFEAALAEEIVTTTPLPIAELFERIRALDPKERASATHSPEQALDAALVQLNFCMGLNYARAQLLQALRTPSAILIGNDPSLKLLLSAFIDDTDEALLIRIAEGTEISWDDLSLAAEVGLPAGGLKVDWIAARSIRSGSRSR